MLDIWSASCYNNGMKLKKAIQFATKAHEGQVRKYTGEPYIVHPLEVVEIVKTVEHTEEMLMAAVLHDTVEDTDTTIQDIDREFGPVVAQLVSELTDVSKPEDGNRATRKGIDRDHLSQASAQGQTIKIADLISNTGSITEHDPKFAKIYMKEKALLLQVLDKADKILLKKAQKVLDIWSASCYNTGIK